MKDEDFTWYEEIRDGVKYKLGIYEEGTQWAYRIKKEKVIEI